MPNTAPQTPTACARSRGSVKVLVMIDIATGFSIEAPTACSTRNATSSPTLGARLHSSDASGEDASRPMTKMRLRPSRSAVEPDEHQQARQHDRVGVDRPLQPGDAGVQVAPDATAGRRSRR